MQEYRRHWMEFREKEIIWAGEYAQKNFLSIAMPVLEKIVLAENENKALAALRDTLLPELMSGRIRVSEAREVVQEATDTELPGMKMAKKLVKHDSSQFLVFTTNAGVGVAVRYEDGTIWLTQALMAELF